MESKQYLTALINNSSTIRETAAVDIPNAAQKAVTFDQDGKLVLPAANGDPVIGVVLSDVSAYENGENLVTKAGTDVDVLIRDIGLMETGEAIAKGDLISVNTSGQAVKATAGNFILGMAFTAAENAGELIQIQITKSGFHK